MQNLFTSISSKCSVSRHNTLIEQVLIRSMKSTGGLTRGRCTEDQMAVASLCLHQQCDAGANRHDIRHSSPVSSAKMRQMLDRPGTTKTASPKALAWFPPRFYEKVPKSSSTVQLHSLPPTSAAASYHSARVYLQVQQWMGKGDDLGPEEWCWLRVPNRLEPRMTDLPPAPEALLKVVRCTGKHDCDTRRCSCKKHGQDCSVACGECKGNLDQF